MNIEEALKIVNDKNFIFFDLDNTLVKTAKIHEKAYSIARKKSSKKDKIYEIKKNIYLNLLNSENLVQIEAAVTLFKKSIELGKKVAVITNTTRENAEFILKKIDLEPDLLIAGDDPTSKLKPDPCMYKNAVNHFAAAEEDCVVFEDDPHGAMAAFQAGLRVIDIKAVKIFRNNGLLFNIIPTSVDLLKKSEEKEK